MIEHMSSYLTYHNKEEFTLRSLLGSHDSDRLHADEFDVSGYSPILVRTDLHTSLVSLASTKVSAKTPHEKIA